MRSKLSITLDEANLAIAAAVEAASVCRPVSIAVVDEAGSSLAFQRMDGARPYTVDLALQKARASSAVGVPSAVIAAAGNRDLSAGGMPIMFDEACMGAEWPI